ncbi:MAG: hypothetical protein D6780_08495, partial [Candidatus Dadabacteria bacterium]
MLGKVVGSHKPALFSTNLKDLVTPSPYQLISTFFTTNQILNPYFVEHSSYIGVGLLLAVLYTLLYIKTNLKPRAYLLILSVFFFLLSFGPALLPYKALKTAAAIAPPVPSRFSALGLFFLILYLG